jgi:hypothetical protein
MHDSFAIRRAHLCDDRLRVLAGLPPAHAQLGPCKRAPNACCPSLLSPLARSVQACLGGLAARCPAQSRAAAADQPGLSERCPGSELNCSMREAAKVTNVAWHRQGRSLEAETSREEGVASINAIAGEMNK